MAETYQIARNNRYWHVVGDGSCGSVEADAVERYLHREGSWDELSEALDADPAPRCDDCSFPDE